MPPCALGTRSQNGWRPRIAGMACATPYSMECASDEHTRAVRNWPSGSAALTRPISASAPHRTAPRQGNLPRHIARRDGRQGSERRGWGQRLQELLRDPRRLRPKQVAEEEVLREWVIVGDERSISREFRDLILLDPHERGNQRCPAIQVMLGRVLRGGEVLDDPRPAEHLMNGGRIEGDWLV